MLDQKTEIKIETGDLFGSTVTGANLEYQGEYIKLQAQVREKIYLPLYRHMLMLKNKMDIEKHPRKIYNKEEPNLFFDSQNQSLPDFTIWNKIKNSGYFMDIYGINDSDMIDTLNNFSELIDRYNSLTGKHYPAIEKFLSSEVGRYKDIIFGRIYPDRWEDIKEEIFSNHPIKGYTVDYLRNSEKEIINIIGKLDTKIKNTYPRTKNH